MVASPLAGHGVGLVVGGAGQQGEPAALQVARQRAVPLYCIPMTQCYTWISDIPVMTEANNLSDPK